MNEISSQQLFSGMDGLFSFLQAPGMPSAVNGGLAAADEFKKMLEGVVHEHSEPRTREPAVRQKVETVSFQNRSFNPAEKTPVQKTDHPSEPKASPLNTLGLTQTSNTSKPDSIMKIDFSMDQAELIRLFVLLKGLQFAGNSGFAGKLPEEVTDENLKGYVKLLNQLSEDGVDLQGLIDNLTLQLKQNWISQGMSPEEVKTTLDELGDLGKFSFYLVAAREGTLNQNLDPGTPAPTDGDMKTLVQQVLDRINQGKTPADFFRPEDLKTLEQYVSGKSQLSDGQMDALIQKLLAGQDGSIGTELGKLVKKMNEGDAVKPQGKEIPLSASKEKSAEETAGLVKPGSKSNLVPGSGIVKGAENVPGVDRLRSELLLNGKNGDSLLSEDNSNTLLPVKGIGVARPGGETTAPVRFVEPGPVPGSILEKRVVAQIAEKMVMSLQSDKNSIRVQLDPPSLGNIQMKLTYDNHQLRAVIVAENPMVRDMLENQGGQLKQHLLSQGIHLDEFAVFVQDQGTRGNPFGSSPDSRGWADSGYSSDPAGDFPGEEPAYFARSVGNQALDIFA